MLNFKTTEPMKRKQQESFSGKMALGAIIASIALYMALLILHAI